MITNEIVYIALLILMINTWCLMNTLVLVWLL